MPRMSAEERAAVSGAPAGTCRSAVPLEARHHLWVDILSSKPADWFDASNLPLLAQYCSVIATTRVLIVELNALQDDPQHDQQAAPGSERRIRKRRRRWALAGRLSCYQATINRHSDRMLAEKETARRSVASRARRLMPPPPQSCRRPSRPSPPARRP